MVPNPKDCERLMYQHIKVVTSVKRTSGHEVASAFLSDIDSPTVITYSGYLKAYDPISSSIILCKFSDNRVTNNTLILGHIIRYIQRVGDEEAIKPSKAQQIIDEDTQKKLENHPYFKAEAIRETISHEETISRRDDIISWLSKNRIPATFNNLTNEICIAEEVRIRAPYYHTSDYICPSRVILKRVKQIVDSRS